MRLGWKCSNQKGQIARTFYVNNLLFVVILAPLLFSVVALSIIMLIMLDSVSLCWVLLGLLRLGYVRLELGLGLS